MRASPRSASAGPTRRVPVTSARSSSSPDVRVAGAGRRRHTDRLMGHSRERDGMDAWRDGRLSRVYHNALAAFVAAALIVQLVIVLRNGLLPRPTRVIRFLSFFTVESNILVAVGAAMLPTNPFRDGRWWRVVRLDGLIGVAVTAVIYHSVLAGLQNLTGWDRAADVALHYVSPMAAVLGWLAFGPRPRIDATTVRLALVCTGTDGCCSTARW